MEDSLNLFLGVLVALVEDIIFAWLIVVTETVNSLNAE